VTDRVEAQQQLRASQDQLRKLAANLQTAREEERAGLARELHDELGQTLTALKLELRRTLDLLKTESLNPAVMNRLQSLVGLVEIGRRDGEADFNEAAPAELDHLGLAEAIRWEAVTFRAAADFGVSSWLRATARR
jgi:two-component system sensor kinase